MGDVIKLHQKKRFTETSVQVLNLLEGLSTTQATSLIADLYVFLGTLVFKDSDQCERYIKHWIDEKFVEYGGKGS